MGGTRAARRNAPRRKTKTQSAFAVPQLCSLCSFGTYTIVSKGVTLTGAEKVQPDQLTVHGTIHVQYAQPATWKKRKSDSRSTAEPEFLWVVDYDEDEAKRNKIIHGLVLKGLYRGMLVIHPLDAEEA